MSGLGSRRVVLPRVLVSLSVAGASFLGAGLTGASALEPGPAGAVIQTDWWNRLPARVSRLDFDSGNVAVEFLGTAPFSGASTMAAPRSEAAAPAPLPAEVATAISPRFRPRPQAVLIRHLAGFWEDLPTSTALLIPVAFGLALLVGLALGPSGRPQPVGKRAGGLSRALDRRRGGGGDVI